MNNSVRPTDENIERIVETYSDMLFKICFVMLCNEHDAEDAVQDTFIKYISQSPDFDNAEYEKAWLIRVSENICRNMMRFNFRHRTVNIDDLYDCCRDTNEISTLETIMSLPAKYKSVLHLFYVERYKTDEIAKMLMLSPSTVRKRLQYGRELLRLEYDK